MKSTVWLDSLDQRLADQFRFLLEVDRLKTVMRGNRIADSSRKENTAEHSWHIALFASVLAEWSSGNCGRSLKLLKRPTPSSQKPLIGYSPYCSITSSEEAPGQITTWTSTVSDH